MDIPRQDELRLRLEESGWNVVEEIRTNLDWYADEMWCISSSWRPEGLQLFLTFLVDPMIDGNRKDGEGVWAVGTSDRPPQTRTEAEGKPLVVLNRRWSQSLLEFVQALNEIRSRALEGGPRE